MNLIKLILMIMLLVPIATAQGGGGSSSVTLTTSSAGGGGTYTEPSCLTVEQCEMLIEKKAAEVKKGTQKSNRNLITILLVGFGAIYFLKKKRNKKFAEGLADMYARDTKEPGPWITPNGGKMTKQEDAKTEPIRIDDNYFDDNEYNKII